MEPHTVTNKHKRQYISKKSKTPEEIHTYNDYMCTYMKGRYEKDKIRGRLLKNCLNIKKRYYIDEITCEKYRENIYNIVKLKEIIALLPSGMFEQFMSEIDDLKFELIENE